MGNSISAAAPALCAAISALDLVNLLDPHRMAADTMAAPALGHAIWSFLLPLAAAGGLLTSVALIYNHFHRATAAVASGAGNRRVPELVKFMLCLSAGFLHFILFVMQAPSGGGAAHRALGLAAMRSLPTVATATYFLGVLLIIVGHIRSGGEGGGGSFVVRDGPIEGHVGVGLLLLTKMATAVLLCLMAMAVCFI